MAIYVKRIYEGYSEQDGFRVLVDRVWPRGISKEKAGIDWWAKDIAPSRELRKWFNHDPEKWDQFRKSYLQELDKDTDTINELCRQARSKDLTLLFAAKNTEMNNAVVLRDYLKHRC